MQYAPVVLFSFIFSTTSLLAITLAAFKAGRWFEHNKIWSVRRAEAEAALKLEHLG